MRGCVREHLRQPRAQAIPHNLHTNRHQDESRQSRQNVGARLAEHRHQTPGVSVTHPDQYAEQEHSCQCRQEMAGETMLKTRSGLVSQVGAERYCDGDAARANGDRKC